MKRIITTLALAATMVLGTASVALAGEPNCADFGWKNHGEHVTGYANPGVPGGARGGPAHFESGTNGPGASFCQTHGPNNAKPLGASL